MPTISLASIPTGITDFDDCFDESTGCQFNSETFFDFRLIVTTNGVEKDVDGELCRDIVKDWDIPDN